MSLPSTLTLDPTRDLVLERVVDLTPEEVWAAWTTPELLKAWFCPKPWQTTECDIELRPGGAFRTVMRGPEGEQNDSTGCYLEVVPGVRLVWTSALLPGFRPHPDAGMPGIGAFTALVSLERVGTRTRYTAVALHRDAAAAKVHADMGFTVGWGLALDQLVAHMQGLRGR
jgi:uncharacterized protein YndB with AHSA1/START domain